MGVFIYLSVSHSVTQAEWELVYQEALDLAQKLGLAEGRRIKIGGITVQCLAVTQERTQTFGWRQETWTGFEVSGDYETLQNAETNSFPKFLEARALKHEYQDAMLETYRGEHDRQYGGDIYSLLGAKTQGYSHHIPLLAVCCLIEDRLGYKAYTYGDITSGQCRRAVELANHYLDQPISIPAACDAGRLIRRVRAMPIAEEEQIKVLHWAYQGRKDATLGAALRAAFGDSVCDSYWMQRFQGYRVATSGFSQRLAEYLDMGFDLGKLCRFYPFEVSGEVDERKQFIEELLSSGLCDDAKEEPFAFIDPEEESPYGIDALFGQIFFGTDGCRPSERHIPTDECRAILQANMDCPDIIDACFAEYRDRRNAEAENAKEEPAAEESREGVAVTGYDIDRFEDLERFKSGMTVEPELLAAMRKYYMFYDGITSEPGFSEYCREDLPDRLARLASNQSLVLRDREWKTLYEKMKGSPEHRRYYPAGRVRIGNAVVRCAVRFLLLNDDLYAMLQDKEEESI